VPLLDIYILAFHIWAIILGAMAVKSGKPFFYIFSMIILGMAMMTKIFTVTLPLYAIITVFWIIRYPRNLIPVIFSGICIFGIFCLSYWRIFQDGMTPVDILKIQKWIFWYNQSKINRFFTIWPLIFQNRWYVWWGPEETISDKSWNLSWPVLFGGSFIYQAKALIMRFKGYPIIMQMIIIWTLIYFILMSLSQASARYLLPVMPYVYLMTVFVITDIIGFIKGIVKNYENRD
jgi:hypothetical protein